MASPDRTGARAIGAVALRIAAVVLAALGAARGASAGQAEPPRPKGEVEPEVFGGAVEVSPFAGVQFGGSVDSTVNGRRVDFGTGLAYGATVDIAVLPGWRLELLYSRQETELDSRGDVERVQIGIERYLAGIQEEQGDGRTRFFGVFLLGATRFAPGLRGYDSDVRFTAAAGLGIKHFVTPRLGLRAEARGFFVDVNSGAGLVCAGGCLFVFNGSGLWQGDVTGGITVGF